MTAGRPQVVLASASPRRRELLEGLGYAVEVRPAAIDETPRAGEDGPACARRLAAEKAGTMAGAAGGRPVLAADTVVLTGDEILGKPRDAADAARMLRLLSGRAHDVVTAVALHTGDTVRVAEACTRVTFAVLTDDEIARYTSGPEPYDKAGAYALQGIAAWFIERVEGSVTNVIGLPLETVRTLFRDAGLPGPPLR